MSPTVLMRGRRKKEEKEEKGFDKPDERGIVAEMRQPYTTTPCADGAFSPAVAPIPRFASTSALPSW